MVCQSIALNDQPANLRPRKALSQDRKSIPVNIFHESLR